jgi:hypothetical protein
VQVGLSELAILIAVDGTGALLRDPSRRGGYYWRATSQLTRRPDLDANPEPEWLQRARVSPRPNTRLYWLLGLTPAPPDTLDPWTTDPADDPPAPMFDTDASGRPR